MLVDPASVGADARAHRPRAATSPTTGRASWSPTRSSPCPTTPRRARARAPPRAGGHRHAGRPRAARSEHARSEYPGVWVDAGGPAPEEDRRHRRADGAGRPGPPPHPARRRAQRHHRPGHVRAHRAVRHRRPRGDLAARPRGSTWRWTTSSTPSWRVPPPRSATGGRRALRRRDRPRRPTPSRSAPSERPLLRRLRQAGVAPEEGLDLAQRKPPWVRVPVRIGKGYRRLGATDPRPRPGHGVRGGGLPEHLRVLGRRHGDLHDQRRALHRGPAASARSTPAIRCRSSPDEPDRVARAVARMGLGHAVVTCVARDDLADGGAGAMAATIRAIRARTPGTTVEVLISDCKGDAASLDAIFEARPDVLNHNIETVARLQRAVRPSAGYARSLAVLARAARPGWSPSRGSWWGWASARTRSSPPWPTCARSACPSSPSASTCGPSRDHLPVSRYWTPEEFDRLAPGRGRARASPTSRRRRSPGRATTPGRPPQRGARLSGLSLAGEASTLQPPGS